MINIKRALKLNPNLNPSLFLPDPKKVWESLNKTPVKEWLEFISHEHLAKESKILLFVPCTPKKPYDPPRDEFHKRLLQLEKDYSVYLVSVSEPLALEPREFWNFKWKGFNLIYDAPFFPWIEKYGYKWSKEIAEKVWKKLAKVAGRWYERNKNKFEYTVAYALPESNYREILKYVDATFVPEIKIKEDTSYEENTEKTYLNPLIWKKLVNLIKKLS